jgi:hypothetical protein
LIDHERLDLLIPCVLIRKDYIVKAFGNQLSFTKF